MNHRERVLAALRCEEPDRVPFCEMNIAPNVLRAISGRDEELSEREVSLLLGRDNVRFDATPPFLATKSGSGGRLIAIGPLARQLFASSDSSCVLA